MPATFNDGLAKGRNTSTALTKKAFVTYDTAATDGETVKMAGYKDATPPLGVTKFSVSISEIAHGKGASVVIDGRAIVTVGAAGDLTIGTPVTSDASGLAQAAVSGDWLCGIVDEPGVVGGDCTVLLADPGTIYKP